MEIRAPYVIVGVVTVLAFAALAAFAVWLADATLGEERQRYDIFFEDPVSGLDVDSPVRFNGVRVGRVVAARIDRERPTRIRVTVEVGAETPIQEGAHATVLPQGITGTSYVQIESGAEAGPPLVAKPGQPRPVIPSRTSPLQRLVGGAPDLVTQSTVLVERLAKLADEENRRALTRSLARIEAITSDMAEQSESLAGVAADLSTAAAETRAAARSVDAAAQGVLDWLEGDLAALTAEARSSLGDARGLMRRLDANLNGRLAPRLIEIAIDAERVVERAASIADQLEASPAEFLREDPVREVQVR